MTEGPCPFCDPPTSRVFYQSELVVGLWDRYPVSAGHALLVPRRHIADLILVTAQERQALWTAVDAARERIDIEHRPDGYNIGINLGTAAGQTIPHLHIHVIPRYAGDVSNPTGGVRSVIPERADYLKRETGLLGAAPHASQLVSGGDDPLLPHLVEHLSRAKHVDIAVAFVLRSGVRQTREHLEDLLSRRGRLRLLTGDYMDGTDPNALRLLLDLASVWEESVQLRVFETHTSSFHPKTYIFRDSSGEGLAFIGSSNLSESALGSGLEWNYRILSSREHSGFKEVTRAFEDLFHHPSTVTLTPDWVDAYEHRRRPERARAIEVVRETPDAPPQPNAVQRDALRKLAETRAEGNRAGLVVLATGIGKTWLSAFDSNRPEFRRILFVAHREEILAQSLDTFRKIRPGARLGHYNGRQKQPDADVLFASIQTLGRANHLRVFDRNEFDYIVVDEFHHAAAATYRRLIEYFEPKFLLGLTATPERTDGGDLLALCGENLVYRCDLAEGIRRGFLSPFHYFGVPDAVDYANIPWRSGRFSTDELTEAVATQARAQNALEQHRTRGGARTLAFCCSTRHADFMSGFFKGAGLRAVAVHSDETSAPRTRSLEELEAGELDIVFSVDMFNEGVDVPQVDTVMMLRPTESRILWLQQLGRGLRRAEGKTHLNVIDYIGNHRTFLLQPQILFDLGTGDGEVAQALRMLEEGTAELPPGCEVTYDLEAVDILKGLLRVSPPNVVKAYYDDFRSRRGVRPTASQVFHEGYNPRSVRKAHGSWLRFVSDQGDLDDRQQAALNSVGQFLDSLDTTPMTKSYKMLVLRALLNENQLPGKLALGELRGEVHRICSGSAVLRADLGQAAGDEKLLEELLVKNPIAAWTGGKGTGGKRFFSYEHGVLHAMMEVPDEYREAFQELTRELVEWRLAEYLLRGNSDTAPGEFLIKVNHSNKKPILHPLDRERNPDLPEGWTEVIVGDGKVELNFAKVAVNVARRREDGYNELPAILRGWFGPDAGLPGTNHQVVLKWDGKHYELTPFGRSSDKLEAELWRRYSREEIPGLFGLEFNPAIWNSGFISTPGHLFLLVTLEKKDMMSDFQYRDRFLDPTHFQWQSQNRTTQQGKHGQLISRHEEQGASVHLLIRSSKRAGVRAAPFIYCGEVSFLEWEGERPITVRWELPEAVPRGLWDELSIKEQ